MKAGDLIFFSGNSFISRIIQIFTLSKFSHVGIVIDENNMLEALKDGVVITSFQEVNKRKDKKLYCPLKFYGRRRFNAKKFNIFVNSVVGKPYDYCQAVVSALDSYGILQNKEDMQKYFCSELACKCLEEAEILDGINESVFSPADLYKFLKSEFII